MKRFPLFLFLIFAMHYSFSQSGTEFTAKSDSNVLDTVDQEAFFPGGNEGWIMYLQKHLKANVPIKKKAPAGSYQVIIKFIVAVDGSVLDLVSETSFGYGMEEEVIRVIKKGPKWSPAILKGKPVNAYRRQPVTFVISEK